MSDQPLGYTLLDGEDDVRDGDLWCHHGDINRWWLPASIVGTRLHNNDYCRRVDLDR